MARQTAWQSVGEASLFGGEDGDVFTAPIVADLKGAKPLIWLRGDPHTGLSFGINYIQGCPLAPG